ncbi:hypothetical protein QWZ10_23255 [Paracoccus cavernae]|uniref:Uncharacterized protein n=1 Tax=Paracoccus cavernae TaxID=1571207 RepID=A0ABT8DFR8_9RHOB|nr:hypothetical protein [Paracoccus cavernae]
MSRAGARGFGHSAERIIQQAEPRLEGQHPPAGAIDHRADTLGAKRKARIWRVYPVVRQRGQLAPVILADHIHIDAGMKRAGHGELRGAKPVGVSSFTPV